MFFLTDLSFIFRTHDERINKILKFLLIEAKSLFLESGSKYAVEHDLIAVLIKLYQEWHHADQKNRYILLRKAILSNIKVCTNYGEFV